MNFESRELSKDDFYSLFQQLRPQPFNYFNFFLAMSAALIFSSLVVGVAAHIYMQHQIGEAQQAAALSIQKFNESLEREREKADRLAYQRRLDEQNRVNQRSQCFELRQQYTAQPTPAVHATMAQACTRAGISY